MVERWCYAAVLLVAQRLDRIHPGRALGRDDPKDDAGEDGHQQRSDDGEQGQTLRIKAPWGGKDLPLTVSNTFTSVSGVCPRTADQKDDGVRTGIYKIYSDKPYNPAKAGIKGYESDLGSRIHLIRMECLTDNSHERDR